MLVDLRGREVRGHTGTIPTSGRPSDHNTATAPDTVAPRPFDSITRDPRGLVVELPPHSYATLSLALG